MSLAVEHDQLLHLLKSIDAARTIRQQEPFIWDYCDASLQIDSRLTVRCIEEQKLIRLARTYYEGKEEKGFLLDFARQVLFVLREAHD